MSQEEYKRICSELAERYSEEKPDAYNRLSSTKKELLFYWISKAIRSAPRYDRNHSSEHLVQDFETQTGIQVSHAAFKGAMLVAGYLPHRAAARDWYFKIRKTYDRRADPPRLTPQGLQRHLPLYRTQLNGKREPALQLLIEQVKEQDRQQYG